MKNIVIIIMGVLLLGFTNIVSAEKEWTRTEILKIADEEAISSGYDIDKMSVSFNSYNTEWNSYLKGNESLSENNDIGEDLGLKNKNYLAVYYASLNVYYASLKKLTSGGDFWVFIDLDNGKVITGLKGQ